MDSILTSVKSYLGHQAADTSFDADILMAINAVLFTLPQLGVGPENPFVVTSDSQKWTDLLGEDPVGGVREYVNMKVRMLFDPPTNTYVMEALKSSIEELEWRLIVNADKKNQEVESG